MGIAVWVAGMHFDAFWCNQLLAAANFDATYSWLQLILNPLHLHLHLHDHPFSLMRLSAILDHDRAGLLLLKQTEDHPSPIQTNCNRLKEMASLPHLGDEILRGDVYCVLPFQGRFLALMSFSRAALNWYPLNCALLTSDEKGDMNFSAKLIQINPLVHSWHSQFWAALQLHCVIAHSEIFYVMVNLLLVLVSTSQIIFQEGRSYCGSSILSCGRPF